MTDSGVPIQQHLPLGTKLLSNRPSLRQTPSTRLPEVPQLSTQRRTHTRSRPWARLKVMNTLLPLKKRRRFFARLPEICLSSHSRCVWSNLLNEHPTMGQRPSSPTLFSFPCPRVCSCSTSGSFDGGADSVHRWQWSWCSSSWHSENGWRFGNGPSS